MTAVHSTGEEDQEKLIIEGPQELRGTVRISGAKNSAAHLLPVSLLTNREIILSNFPATLVDVKAMLRLMENLGAVHERRGNEIVIRAEKVGDDPRDYTTTIRTTYLLAAGQLLRNGIARIPYPGGCAIGERKYDLHIMLWKLMGCEVREEQSHIELTCGELKGADIPFPFPTIGGTANALLCGVRARGRTRIYNAYISPELLDLIHILRSMGARITVKGNTYIEIEGVNELSGTSHRIIPDRIEAVFWIVAAAITKGELIIQDVPFSFMEVPMIHLREIGINFYTSDNALYINHHDHYEHYINPFEIACGVYPGVISDMQPFFTVLATQAKGNSRVIDYRYPSRFSYIEELRKLGGEYGVSEGEVKLTGPIRFTGNEVRATDLRGGAALMLAALIARGKTAISDFRTILRGYDNLASKLESTNIEYDTSS